MFTERKTWISLTFRCQPFFQSIIFLHYNIKSAKSFIKAWKVFLVAQKYPGVPLLGSDLSSLSFFTGWVKFWEYIFPTDLWSFMLTWTRTLVHLPAWSPGCLCLVSWFFSPPSLLAFGFDLLLDYLGEVPSTGTASSEPNHQIQMLLEYFKAEGKTSEALLVCEQSEAPVQANKLSI